MRTTLVILAAVGLIACGDITGPHGDVSLSGRIAFVSDTGQYALMHMRPDGSDLEVIPIQLPAAPLELDVSPDGRRLLFVQFFDFSQEVFVVNADGTGLPKTRVQPNAWRTIRCSSQSILPRDAFVSVPESSDAWRELVRSGSQIQQRRSSRFTVARKL